MKIWNMHCDIWLYFNECSLLLILPFRFHSFCFFFGLCLCFYLSSLAMLIWSLFPPFVHAIPQSNCSEQFSIQLACLLPYLAKYAIYDLHREYMHTLIFGFWYLIFFSFFFFHFEHIIGFSI